MAFSTTAFASGTFSGLTTLPVGGAVVFGNPTLGPLISADQSLEPLVVGDPKLEGGN